MEVEIPKPNQSKPSAFTLARTMQLAVEFGFVMAIPVVAFGLGGKWLDSHTHHYNFFVLFGILFALVCSVALLTKRINGIRKELKK